MVTIKIIYNYLRKCIIFFLYSLILVLMEIECNKIYSKDHLCIFETKINFKKPYNYRYNNVYQKQL